MAYGVGASGFVGIAAEAVSGTYVAPTFFLSLRNESMKFIQETYWRRVMRGNADVSGGIAGNVRVEGSLEVELIEDGFVNLLRAARGAITKTGAAAPYNYVFAANSAVVPAKTLSITVVRNGVVFGYTGCAVSGFNVTVDNGILVGSFDILGSDEATQALPTATFSAFQPFGQGQYTLEIPTATQIFDVENFTFSVNDNAQAQYRLKSPSRGAQFTKYGERAVELSMSRDFESRAEYDAFKALTAQTITLKASKNANENVLINMPVAVKDDYDVKGLSGQGDLIMADVKYIGTNTGSGAYSLTINSATSITIP